MYRYEILNLPSLSNMDGSAFENSSSITSVIMSSLPYLGMMNVLRSALKLKIKAFTNVSYLWRTLKGKNAPYKTTTD